MSTQFEQNLLFLKKHRVQLYNQVVENIGNPTFYGLIEANNGKANLYIQSGKETRYMYNQNDPEIDSHQWVETLTDDDIEQDIIIYGIGLTYHLAAYITKFRNHRLYIHEPDINIFIESLKILSLEDLVSHPSIIYLSVGHSIEEVGGLLFNYYTYANKLNKMICTPYYEQYFLTDYINFKNKSRSYIANFISREQFSLEFGKYMHKNIFFNINKVLSSSSLQQLKDTWTDKTVIIVGAGPSLEQDLPILKKLQDNVIIIAAGTSIQTLLMHEIKPHLIVSMDAYTSNLQAFENIDTSNIPLLFIPTIHHQILEKPESILIHAFFKHIEEYNYLFDLNEDEHPVFIGSHSVTGTVIQAAAYLGAKQIIFNGQDLSYPDKRMYANGVSHISKQYENSVANEMVDKVENVFGGYNPTTLKMKITLEDIELIIAKYPHISYINASRGGAKIAGTQYIELSNVVLSDSYSRQEFIDECHKFPQFYNQQLKNSIVNRVVEQKLWLTHSIGIMKKLIKQLSELELLSRTNQNKAMKILASIEENWSQIISHLNFKCLLEDLLIIELRKLDKSIPNIQQEQNLIKKSKLMKEALEPLLDNAIKQANITIEYIECNIDDLRNCK